MLLLTLAVRNIFRQRRRSLLTGLSLAGGYVLCALSVSLSDGSYSNAIRFFTLDHTGHIQIHKDNYYKRPKIHKTIDDPRELSTLLDAHEDIQNHTLRVFAPALAYSDSDNTQVSVIGVDLTREEQTSRLAGKVSSGDYITEVMNNDGYYSAMIGVGVAKSLGIDISDEIILISQGADGSIANDIYVVGAIVGDNNSQDKLNVYLPLYAAQEFLSLQGRVHEVSILLHNADDARQTAASLQDQLSELSVNPWQVVEATFYATMQADREGMHLTLGIIIFIVFVGVLNTVLMSVLERTREFGVLKAIGSRPATLVSLITLETSLLSIISMAVGFVVAVPIILWFALVGIESPEPMDVGGVVMNQMTGDFTVPVFTLPLMFILGFSLLISIPCGIRAARISPTEAMRSH